MSKKIISIIFSISVLLLSACAKEEIPTQVFTATPAVIEFYSSPTPQLLTISLTPTIQATDLPLPTATPVIYTVVANDTLIGIAYKYGISLNEILGANPSVDPNFLSIGVQLTIPTGGSQGGVALLPDVTPEAVGSASNVKCYPSSEGGLSCLWLLSNDHDYPLENISARVSLLNSYGETVNEGIAILPVNLLPAGKSMPVMVYFPYISGAWSQAQAQILTALPVLNDSERYLKTAFSELEISYGDSEMYAFISGVFGLMDPLQTSSENWILAIAYDQDNNVVGVRRWESSFGLEAGEQQGFSMNVYSLGPPISEIKVFLESRP